MYTCKKKTLEYSEVLKPLKEKKKNIFFLTHEKMYELKSGLNMFENITSTFDRPDFYKLCTGELLTNILICAKFHNWSYYRLKAKINAHQIKQILPLKL